VGGDTGTGGQVDRARVSGTTSPGQKAGQQVAAEFARRPEKRQSSWEMGSVGVKRAKPQAAGPVRLCDQENTYFSAE